MVGVEPGLTSPDTHVVAPHANPARPKEVTFSSLYNRSITHQGEPVPEEHRDSVENMWLMDTFVCDEYDKNRRDFSPTSETDGAIVETVRDEMNQQASTTGYNNEVVSQMRFAFKASALTAVAKRYENSPVDRGLYDVGIDTTENQMATAFQKWFKDQQITHPQAQLAFAMGYASHWLRANLKQNGPYTATRLRGVKLLCEQLGNSAVANGYKRFLDTVAAKVDKQTPVRNPSQSAANRLKDFTPVLH